jgi:hypothetical protein
MGKEGHVKAPSDAVMRLARTDHGIETPRDVFVFHIAVFFPLQVLVRGDGDALLQNGHDSDPLEPLVIAGSFG